MEQVTTDTILNWIEEKVKNKEPVAPHIFMEASQKLVVLMGDEQSKLYDLQQLVSQQKVYWIEQDKSATEAKLRTESLDIYKDMLKQKAKVERIIEYIRICKLSARMASDEIKSY